MKPSICYLTYRSVPPDERTIRAILDALPEDGGPRLLFLSFTVPAPFPASDITDDIEQRGAWPTWREDIRGWKGHVVLSALGAEKTFEGKRREAARVLHAAAAVANATGADSVAWSGSMVFRPTAAFMAEVKLDGPPVTLLVRSRWVQAPGEPGPEMRTRGLDTLGLPEFHHVATGEPPVTIFTRVMNLCAYVLTNGPVLKDGHTFGTDERPAMRVHETVDEAGAPLLRLAPLRPN